MRDFLETPGVYCDPLVTHARVASDSSFVILLSLVERHDSHMKQLDAKTAFLESPIEHEVWVGVLAGYDLPSGHTFPILYKSFYVIEHAVSDGYALQYVRRTDFDPDLLR